VVLEADTVNRFSTERLLRREDYWTFATDDPRAVVRVVTVAAADLVLVDLGLEALDPIPPWERRKNDASFREPAPVLADGYAILRPLYADPACARFPLVTLRPSSRTGEPVPFCRFAVVDYVPRASRPTELVEGLDGVFRDVVLPVQQRELDIRESAPSNGKPTRGQPSRSAVSLRPFASTPPPLRTALVVDPDAASRRSVRESLVRHGFTIYEAARGDEGLRQAVARRPWLILTELNLPDQSGLDFCQQARGHSLLRRTPLAFISDWDDCESRYLALKAGADDYLAKPAAERELLIRLELLLKRFGEIDTSGVAGQGLRGTLELVGAPAVLQICHLNQLTGVLTAHRGSRSVRIAFRNGEVVSAAGPDQQGPEAVYDFVGWPQGEYEFDAGAMVEGPHFDADFNGLLLEGCRRLDERRRPSASATPGF
jgi:DNA-binding response OmpR family regulator